MGILIVGILLWSGMHLIPAALPGPRQSVIDSLGEGPYKGGFALTIVASIVVMVWGFQIVVPALLYVPPTWGRIAANLLMAIGFYLFVASNMTTNIKRFLRHPMLWSMVIWAVAHLLSNGEARSVVLFGSLGLWALMMMVFVNRRDGEWAKPEPVPLASEWKPALIAIVVFGFAFWLHGVLGLSPRAW